MIPAPQARCGVLGVSLGSDEQQVLKRAANRKPVKSTQGKLSMPCDTAAQKQSIRSRLWLKGTWRPLQPGAAQRVR